MIPSLILIKPKD